MGRPKTQKKASNPKPQANSSRHERDCKVCHHAHREAVEHKWTSWGDTAEIAKSYGLSRDSIYRHAHATGLFEKRSRNIRAALERIIEKAGSVEVTAAAVVSAVQAFAKINAQGQWVDRVEHVDFRDIFDRMNRQELDEYARSGQLPAWTSDFLAATGSHSGGEERDG